MTGMQENSSPAPAPPSSGLSPCISYFYNRVNFNIKYKLYLKHNINILVII